MDSDVASVRAQKRSLGNLTVVNAVWGHFHICAGRAETTPQVSRPLDIAFK